MNGDGTLSSVDVDAWLTQAGTRNLTSGNSFLVGDGNLDGTVDGADFVIWNANKFTSTAAWCGGDFNVDGFVDGADFVWWNANKFMSSGIPAVPEPTCGLWLIVLLSLSMQRRAR
jgi:hypothetical protein